jgi:hypothetical protein
MEIRRRIDQQRFGGKTRVITKFFPRGAISNSHSPQHNFVITQAIGLPTQPPGIFQTVKIPQLGQRDKQNFGCPIAPVQNRDDRPITHAFSLAGLQNLVARIHDIQDLSKTVGKARIFRTFSRDKGPVQRVVLSNFLQC